MTNSGAKRKKRKKKEKKGKKRKKKEKKGSRSAKDQTKVIVASYRGWVGSFAAHVLKGLSASSLHIANLFISLRRALFIILQIAVSVGQIADSVGGIAFGLAGSVGYICLGLGRDLRRFDFPLFPTKPRKEIGRHFVQERKSSTQKILPTGQIIFVMPFFCIAFFVRPCLEFGAIDD